MSTIDQMTELTNIEYDGQIKFIYEYLNLFTIIIKNNKLYILIHDGSKNLITKWNIYTLDQSDQSDEFEQLINSNKLIKLKNTSYLESNDKYNLKYFKVDQIDKLFGNLTSNKLNQLNQLNQSNQSNQLDKLYVYFLGQNYEYSTNSIFYRTIQIINNTHAISTIKIKN